MTMETENIQKVPTLDDRLMTAASYVRHDGVVCDIGTDHAYIPIWLLCKGICSRAVASDINKGPLMRARQHAEEYGVAEKIAFYLSDGLDTVEPEENGVTDICICGMGGELTASILERGMYTRKPEVQMILQPMSSAYELRAYCTANGYTIADEKLCKANGKIYSCMSVFYTNEKTTYSEGELLLGKRNIEKREALFEEYAERHLAALDKKIKGRTAGGLDITYETGLRAELTEIISGK
ncbi:MAG: SAM-dependent methyltransferase [Clostridia bacterium]|nr:SAM-dependent methyltransferase [Clostridia bacterium]